MAIETKNNPELDNEELDTEEQDTQETKYSQSDIDKAISRARKAWEKDSAKKITEAQKLAKMNEEERHQAELNSRIKELEDKERELATKENKIEALKIMNEKGIPAYLVDIVVSHDADEMDAKLKLMDKWQKEIKAAIMKDALRNPSPKGGSTNVETMTAEQFGKLTLTQLADLKKNNPDVYKKFRK